MVKQMAGLIAVRMLAFIHGTRRLLVQHLAAEKTYNIRKEAVVGDSYFVMLDTDAHVTPDWQSFLSPCRYIASGAYLDKGVEEAQPKQQLFEGSRLLTVVEEGWVTDWVIQVAL